VAVAYLNIQLVLLRAKVVYLKPDTLEREREQHESMLTTYAGIEVY